MSRASSTPRPQAADDHSALVIPPWAGRDARATPAAPGHISSPAERARRTDMCAPRHRGMWRCHPLIMPACTMQHSRPPAHHKGGQHALLAAGEAVGLQILEQPGQRAARHGAAAASSGVAPALKPPRTHFAECSAPTTAANAAAAHESKAGQLERRRRRRRRQGGKHRGDRPSAGVLLTLIRALCRSPSELGARNREAVGPTPPIATPCC